MRTVLHILGSAERHGTGIVRVVEAIARRITGFQLEAWFLLEDGPLADDLRGAGVRVRCIPYQPTLSSPFAPLRLWIALQRRRPDLVHQHFGGPRLGRFLRTATLAPWLLHMHTSVIESRGTESVRWSTAYANRVIAVSEAVAKYSQKPAEVVYTGIEPGDSGVDRGKLHSTVIGTAGRLVRVKGIELLLEAMVKVHSKLPEARLEVAGTGPEMEALRKRAADAGLSTSITFLGWERELRRVMRRWAAYVQPSIEDGMPVAMLEAMAEGLPIIGTTVGGIPEAVENDVDGCLVAKGDSSGLADRILRLLNDQAFRRSAGERTRRRVHEQFSSERFGQRMHDIYQEMLRPAASG